MNNKSKYLLDNKIRQSIPPSIFNDAEEVELIIDDSGACLEITHNGGDKLKIGFYEDGQTN